MVIGFIVGLLTSVTLSGVFYLGFDIGRKYQPGQPIKETKETKEKVKAAKSRQQGLNNIMDYDIDVALGRREQNE